MVTSTNRIRAWRKRTKKKLVEGFGGKCCVCKNSHEIELYDFHHLRKEEKTFGIGGSSCKAWARLVAEVAKCIMVCSNCHRLIHNGYVDIPKDAPKFIEVFEEKPKTFCPMCGEEKGNRLKYCSLKCYNKASRKVDWDNVDVIVVLEEHKFNYVQAGKSLGISDNAVKKRYKKVMGL